MLCALLFMRPQNLVFMVGSADETLCCCFCGSRSVLLPPLRCGMGCSGSQRMEHPTAVPMQHLYQQASNGNVQALLLGQLHLSAQNMQSIWLALAQHPWCTLGQVVCVKEDALTKRCTLCGGCIGGWVHRAACAHCIVLAASRYANAYACAIGTVTVIHGLHIKPLVVSQWY